MTVHVTPSSEQEGCPRHGIAFGRVIGGGETVGFEHGGRSKDNFDSRGRAEVEPLGARSAVEKRRDTFDRAVVSPCAEGLGRELCQAGHRIDR